MVISDQQLLADINNQFRIVSFYGKQAVLLKENITQLINALAIENGKH